MTVVTVRCSNEFATCFESRGLAVSVAVWEVDRHHLPTLSDLGHNDLDAKLGQVDPYASR